MKPPYLNYSITSQAVYDLTWEILQDIYAEDPNADQPQWVRPRRTKSSFFHRVKAPGDITKIQVQYYRNNINDNSTLF